MSLNLDKSTWTRVKLGEVAAASKEKVDPTSRDVERYIAGEHMDTDDLRISRWGDVDEVDLGPAFHRRFRPGQVLYGSRRTYLRKVAVAEFDGVCANTTYVVETNDEGVLLQAFLPFVMTSEVFHAFAIGESKGSVNPYVNWSDIARYEFDLPPIEEQERLADLLWAVEHHQRRLMEVNAKLVGEQLRDESATRSALLNHLLSPMDGSWETGPLSQFGTISRGRRFTKSDYVDEGLGCIHYGQIYTDFGPTTTQTVTFVPESLKPTLEFAEPGDVVVAGTSENVRDVCKAVAWLGDSEIAVHDDCFIFRHRLEPRFAAYLFGSADFHEQKARYVSETKVVRVSGANLGRIVVSVPRRDVQVVIADAIDTLTGSGEAVVQEVEQARQLHRGLLTEIFGCN